MPECPEVYLNGQLVKEACNSRFFGGKIVKSAVSKLSEVAFTSDKYTISCETRGYELALMLQCDADKDNKLRILFRLGMTGCFRFTPADEILKYAHLSFFTQDDKPKMALHFVDVCRFGLWKISNSWSIDKGVKRGPDPIQDYENFRANILDNVIRRNKSVFNRAICEVMFRNQFFNGIGCYLRSEILYRAEIPPFTSALTVLEQIKENRTQKSPDFIQLCHDVPKEVINLATGKNYDDFTLNIEDNKEFDKWLRCYNNCDMDSMVDRHNKVVWFRGDPGPLAPKGGRVKKKRAKSATKKDTKKTSTANKKETKQEKDKTDDDNEEAIATTGTKEETTNTKEENVSTKENTSTAIRISKKENSGTSRSKRGKRKSDPKEQEPEETMEQETDEETKPKRRKKGSKN